MNIPQINVREEGVFGLPREKVNENEKWIKHVNCSGSRQHVISYRLQNGKVVVSCNEKDCIMNASYDELKRVSQ